MIISMCIMQIEVLIFQIGLVHYEISSTNDNLKLYVGGKYGTFYEINASNIAVWEEIGLLPSDSENVNII